MNEKSLNKTEQKRSKSAAESNPVQGSKGVSFSPPEAKETAAEEMDSLLPEKRPMVGPFQLAQMPLQHSAGIAAVVQRVTTQIFPGYGTGRIRKVAIVGRPPNTFGNSMGDHTTAFTAIASGIETQLEGKTPREGIQFMQHLKTVMDNLPGMKYTDALPAGHKQKLKEAVSALNTLLAEALSLYAPSKSPKKENSMDVDNKNDADEIIVIDDEMEEEPEPQPIELSLLQQIVDAYLEARELVPLSSVNMSKIDKSKSGHAKGENPDPLIAFEKGNKIDVMILSRSVITLFDRQAVGSAAYINNKKKADEQAPGVPFNKTETQVGILYIDQHFQTLESLYPRSMEFLTKENQTNEIKKFLLHEVMGDNQQEVSESYGLKNKEKVYLTAAVSLDEKENITSVKTEGRPPSPFGTTMGAHTTAWTVLSDAICTRITGKKLIPALGILTSITDETISLLMERARNIPVASENIQRVLGTMNNLVALKSTIQTAVSKGGDSVNANNNKSAMTAPPFSSFELAGLVQSSITTLLEAQNYVPGATLVGGSTGGRGEGALRAVLKNPNGHSKEDITSAIIGMLDLNALHNHIENTLDNIESEEYDDSAQKARINYNKKIGVKETPNPKVDNAIPHFIKHHLKLISEAYPGALAKSKLTESNFRDVWKEEKNTDINDDNDGDEDFDPNA